MKTINLSPSQYRIVHSSSAVECSSTARASRMSQFQATVPNAEATLTKTATKTKRTKTTNYPIYGIVNLALLAVSIYLLWANLL